MRIIHFADAHINCASTENWKLDQKSGFSIRALDFLKSLDQISEAAINNHADLVLFAGDAYQNPLPSTTFQREFQKRILKMAKAGCKVVMIPGNHDMSPSGNKASALQEFETMEIPNIYMSHRPRLWTADELGIPVQIIAIPWMYRSQLAASLQSSGKETETDLDHQIEEIISRLIQLLIDRAEKGIPLILLAHAQVYGARYNGTKTVSLSQTEMMLPSCIVRNPAFSYVALGHLHQYQNLNEGYEPPVIYSGSIERVDAGETEDKGFVQIDLDSNGKASFEFVKIGVRKLMNLTITPANEAEIMSDILQSIPSPDEIRDAILRISIHYPQEWRHLINRNEILQKTELAFSVSLHMAPILSGRARMCESSSIKAKSDVELIDLFLRKEPISEERKQRLLQLHEHLSSEQEIVETPVLQEFLMIGQPESASV